MSRCAFCGRDRASVGRLIAGENACICDSCVEICRRFLSKEGEGKHELRAPKPAEIKDRLDEYGLTFPVAADPGPTVTFKLMDSGSPLNMLLDKNMEIRYKVEALMPDTLEGNIDALLNE